MFNFICSSWEKIKKKFNKLLPLFLCPVLFFCTSLSTFAADSPFFVDGIFNYTFNGQSGHFYAVNSSGSVVASLGSNIATDNNLKTFYAVKNSGTLTINQFSFGITDGYVYPLIIPDLSDYKFLVLCFTGNITPSDFTFSPDIMYLYSNEYEGQNSVMLENLTIKTFGTGLSGNPSTIGYLYYADIPDTYNASLINGFTLQGSVDGTIPHDFKIAMYLYNDKNNDFDSNIDAIVNAINSQTDVFINGNGSTGGIISEFQSNLNEFNSVVNQFDEIENGFISDFTSSNEEIKSTLSDYQLTGNLLTCANWLTDRYMDFFDNSGDFKQYFIYPLIMGIALFFIGRGQVILGQAYRKPYDSTTVTYSESSGYRLNKDGSWSPTGYKGSSSTTTYRSGGKLRK